MKIEFEEVANMLRRHLAKAQSKAKSSTAALLVPCRSAGWVPKSPQPIFDMEKAGTRDRAGLVI